MPKRDPNQEFFETLGRCIAVWASVDEELFRLFQCCVGPVEQAAIIFYRMPGLDVRLNTTDELIRSLLPKRTQKNGKHEHKSVRIWKEIFNRIKDQLAVRRRLAHQPVELHNDQVFQFGFSSFGEATLWDGKSPIPVPRLVVRAGSHERARASSSPRPLDISDLRVHLSSVRILSNDLNDFLRNEMWPISEERSRQNSDN